MNVQTSCRRGPKLPRAPSGHLTRVGHANSAGIAMLGRSDPIEQLPELAIASQPVHNANIWDHCSMQSAIKPLVLSILAAAFSIAPTMGGCARLEKNQLIAISGEPEASRVMALDVQNQFGTVFIEVDRTLTAPRVAAGCQGDTEAARKPEFVSAELVNESGRSILRVLSASPGAGDPKPVDIRIKVPTCDGLRVVNAGGRVYIKGVNGAIDVTNDVAGKSGGTVVIVQDPVTSPIIIKARRGGIDLRVPAESTGRLSAKSTSGTLAIDVGEATIKNAKASLREYSGTLGTTENEITLVADEGDVQFVLGHR